ncbi:MAG TPA: hypothetical protein VMW01_13945 [Williamwhitmania sp.]|nr:hypothetical protein [Williamwhitmania sp.]
MNKTKITEEDAQILDGIIDFVLNNPVTLVGNLPMLGDDYLDKFENVKEDAYKYYLEILKEFDVAEVISSNDRATQIKVLSLKTQKFKDEGGFIRVYVNQQRKEEREARTEEKEILEATLVKWQKYTYWPLFILSIAGFVMAFFALLKD